MMFNIYTIYDKVAKECGPIFASKNDGTAIRQFNNLISDTNNKSEYILYQVGEYYPEDIKLLQVTKKEIKLLGEKHAKKNTMAVVQSNTNNSNN